LNRLNVLNGLRHLGERSDAWVVGKEPVVVVDISGMTHYAKPAARKTVKKSAKAKKGKKKKR
jgi:hypothetical protein